jgi:hypothetical protein
MSVKLRWKWKSELLHLGRYIFVSHKTCFLDTAPLRLQVRAMQKFGHLRGTTIS